MKFYTGGNMNITLRKLALLESQMIQKELKDRITKLMDKVRF